MTTRDTLCRICAKFDPDVLSATHEFPQYGPRWAVPFRKDWENCPMCRLVVACVESDPNIDLFEAEYYRGFAELVGHYSGGEMSLLYSMNSEHRDIHKYSQYAIRCCFNIPDTAPPIVPRFTDYPTTARKWVSRCKASHSHHEMGDRGLPPSFRLIDVFSNKLVLTSSLDEKVLYWALSYLWGGVTQATLLKKNKDALHEAGSLGNLTNPGLPQTIIDAIKFCRKAGQRYLWVDSLCILQDSPEKHTQISAMDIIYNSAELVLVASHGHNPNSGLLPGLEDDSLPDPVKIEEVHGHRLAACRSLWALTSEVSQSPWQLRGWTLQEYALSRRAAIFTNKHVLFTCGSQVFDANFQLIHPFHLGSSDDLRRPDLTTDVGGVHETTLYKIIRRFFLRQLTMDDDILNALEGIFSRCLGGPARHFWGLPEAQFATWFTWCCRAGPTSCRRLRQGAVFLNPSADDLSPCLYRHPNRNRGRRKRSQSVIPCESCSDSMIHPNGVFPSWSWAAWKHEGVACCFISHQIPPANIYMYRTKEINDLIELNSGHNHMSMDMNNEPRGGDKFVETISKCVSPATLASLCFLWTSHCKVFLDLGPGNCGVKRNQYSKPVGPIWLTLSQSRTFHGYVDLVMISIQDRSQNSPKKIFAMPIKYAKKSGVYRRYTPSSFVVLSADTWDQLDAQPKWIALG